VVSLGTVSADAVRAVPAQVATKIHYVFTDHINTPRVITRATDNQMVWRWDNADPFGVAQPNENPAGLGNFRYNPRFPGQLYDAETGLYYNYYRHYDPKTGTYTQSDPIGWGD
jgi:RHS repeat-associated protein